MLCERRVARRRGACEEECEPNPKPRPKPNPSSADVAERGVPSIGVRSSGTYYKAVRLNSDETGGRLAGGGNNCPRRPVG